MKRIFVATLLLITAACAPVPKGAAVPMKQLFSENSSRPFECTDYEASSDSCEGIARRTLRSNTVVYDAEFIMPRLPGVPGRPRVLVNMPFKLESTRYCGDFRTAKVQVRGLPSSYNTDLAIAFKTQLAKEGAVCTSYYRDGGGYVSVTTRPNGEPVRDGIGKVFFLSSPKKLRTISLF
ncbi:MAG: hypothetical protein QNJ20_10350 [Paracoccaceae bacterium]|nr:hypothetical protein [Paracoccaceae bacterium]